MSCASRRVACRVELIKRTKTKKERRKKERSGGAVPAVVVEEDLGGHDRRVFVLVDVQEVQGGAGGTRRSGHRRSKQLSYLTKERSLRCFNYLFFISLLRDDGKEINS